MELHLLQIFNMDPIIVHVEILPVTTEIQSEQL